MRWGSMKVSTLEKLMTDNKLDTVQRDTILASIGLLDECNDQYEASKMIVDREA